MISTPNLVNTNSTVRARAGDNLTKRHKDTWQEVPINSDFKCKTKG